MKTIIGKVAYGILFLIVIPSILFAWAGFTSDLIHLPVPKYSIAGYLLLLAGLGIVISGMLHIWIFGKGLPMNAYPPQYFVKRGIYAITKNPIYAGMALISFGVSIVMQSSSGFWLVSPTFVLMLVAYTIGFENEKTMQVFGTQEYRPYLSLPMTTEDTPSVKDKIAAYILAYVPWFLVYEAFIFAGTPNDAISTNLPFENQWPVIEFSTLFYVLTYLYAFLVPLAIKSKKELRSFVYDIWLAVFIAGLFYFAFPFITQQRSFTSHSWLGNLLLFDRSNDGETAALPSFHVIWVGIAARYFGVGIKRFKWFWYVLSILISVSCVTTANHSVLDVMAGAAVFALIVYRNQLWDFIRLQSECIANSWKEWHWGPVRIINHGFYAGAAGFVGTLLVGSLLGRQYAAAGFVTGLFGIVGAGLWAQFVEGSSKLQRPYGYYGSVVGVLFGSILIFLLFPVSVFTLLAAFSLAAPWIQILGRLRCLVQGCCHGKPSQDWLGIRFTHPLSRVNKISGLPGATLHPTQLYSILTNFITGLVLFRLFHLGMSAPFIIGIYLIINGLGRFVEESFRGETQTPYWAGMRIYQWIAIVTVFVGMIFTTIPSNALAAFQWNIKSFWWAIAMGILATIAYGVDFPTSNRRFARLTSV